MIEKAIRRSALPLPPEERESARAVIMDFFQRLAEYNVVWSEVSQDSSGSMPLGNGDIGLNVWCEQQGDLLFYIGKTDAWSEQARLLKLGLVRIHLTPNPFLSAAPFLQTLRLAEGMIEISVGIPAVTFTIWVDAHHPAIHIEVNGHHNFVLQATVEIWRTQPRTLNGQELHSAYGMHGNTPFSVIEGRDIIVPEQPDRVSWYHHNAHSIWSATQELQGLQGVLPPSADPLLHRTFGAVMKGPGLIRGGENLLRSYQPSRQQRLSITVLTAQVATSIEWLTSFDRLLGTIERLDLELARGAHIHWWHAFWERSWLFVSGTPEAEIVTRGAILQRFINACGGRGNAPIKFNGSIFTVDNSEPDQEAYNADYRRWGGTYWFQNTRLLYWGMLASGDFDLMLPFFKMYQDALPLAEERTRRYFHHEGAFFPETMYFWGAYANSDYGWDRTQKALSYVSNPYIRYYYQGGLELILLLLDYYAYTHDEAFVDSTLLPLTSPILQFYAQHYPREEDGTLRLEPAQTLEMWHEAVNPLPDIAGLAAVLPRLLTLPAHLVTVKQRTDWQRLYEVLPPLPTQEEDGQSILCSAEQISGPAMNTENPELYAIFPYRLSTLGTSDLQRGQETFSRRLIKGTGGWRQDAIQAAYLGLTVSARDDVVKNFSTPHERSRFPGFWGPNFDWVPDQDHGNTALMALQAMLIQATEETLLLFPAWPTEWNVDFKLHVPGNTIIEGTYRANTCPSLTVRRKDAH